MVTLTVCYYISVLKHIQHGKVLAASIKQEIKQYPHDSIFLEWFTLSYSAHFKSKSTLEKLRTLLVIKNLVSCE